jgi:hypothetical protein
MDGNHKARTGRFDPLYMGMFFLSCKPQTKINHSFNKLKSKMLNRKQIRKIESLETTKEELQKVNEYLSSHNKDGIQTSDYNHYLKRETNIQGLCCCCNSIPTKLVTYRSGIVERYCDKHLDRIRDDLNTDNIQEKVIIKPK